MWGKVDNWSVANASASVDNTETMGAKKWPTQSGIDLTLEEQAFVDIYTDFNHKAFNNGTEAYIAAYKVDTSKIKRTMLWALASRMMSKPAIQEAILQKTKTRVNPTWVLAKLESFANKATAKDSDAVRATELLGKAHGLFVDKTEAVVKMDKIAMGDEGLSDV